MPGHHGKPFSFAQTIEPQVNCVEKFKFKPEEDTKMIHLDIEQVAVAHEVVPPDSTLLTNHPTHPVLGHLREKGFKEGNL